MTPFMFATGIENSYPTIRNGSHRVDEMDLCSHYDRWKEDFDLVDEQNIDYLRYGPPIHKTWLGDGVYDWEFSDLTMLDLQRRGITVIADLCHFGVPDWIGNFQNPAFPELFSRYAGDFANRYPWVRYYTPVNEMIVCAQFSGRFGWWNEQGTTDRTFVTCIKHLVRANILACRAIQRRIHSAIFIQAESAEHFHPKDASAVGITNTKNKVRFLSLDLNFGHHVDAEMYMFLRDNGMSLEEYQFFLENDTKSRSIIGTDYYVTCEHGVDSDVNTWGCGDQLGYAAVVQQYYDRYKLPIMHTETNMTQGVNGDEAVKWLEKQWNNVMLLKNSGVPMLGFTWYSLTDQVDWDSALTIPNKNVNALGLYDLDRKIRPVGEAYKALIKDWSGSV